jgi:hypothetical protein
VDEGVFTGLVPSHCLLSGELGTSVSDTNLFICLNAPLNLSTVAHPLESTVREPLGNSELWFRRTERADLGGSRHGRSGKKVAAIIVDLFGHIPLQLEWPA